MSFETHGARLLPPLNRADYAMLRRWTLETLGIALREDQDCFVWQRLAHVAERRGLRRWVDLCALLHAGEDHGLRDEVIDALTTHETSWFRDRHVWEAMRGELLPRLWRELISDRGRTVRIWCAACSTGQEPFSLVMLLVESLEARCLAPDLLDRVTILATDASRRIIQQAAAGIFDQASLARGLGSRRRARWFVPLGPQGSVCTEIRRRVDFRCHNLLDAASGLGAFDLILCRNVLIYFPPDLRAKVSRRIVEQLRPGGALILGSAESLGSQAAALELRRGPLPGWYEHPLPYARPARRGG